MEGNPTEWSRDRLVAYLDGSCGIPIGPDSDLSQEDLLALAMSFYIDNQEEQRVDQSQGSEGSDVVDRRPSTKDSGVGGDQDGGHSSMLAEFQEITSTDIDQARAVLEVRQGSTSGRSMCKRKHMCHVSKKILHTNLTGHCNPISL
jgi:hypothetical protein